MKVAFYGRFSSDKEKDSSIDQQFHNCERYAQREGWTITKRYEPEARLRGAGEATGWAQNNFGGGDPDRTVDPRLMSCPGSGGFSRKLQK